MCDGGRGPDDAVSGCSMRSWLPWQLSYGRLMIPAAEAPAAAAKAAAAEGSWNQQWGNSNKSRSKEQQ